MTIPSREGSHYKAKEDSSEKVQSNQKRYFNSEKGKKTTKKYLSSDKGKKATIKYLDSEKGKAAKLRYLISDKGVQYIEKQNQKLKLAYRCMKWLEENPSKTPQDFYSLLKNGNEDGLSEVPAKP